MQTLILALALAAAAVMAGCATTNRPATSTMGSHANPDGAAFIGFHGPVWRQNTPAD